MLLTNLFTSNMIENLLSFFFFPHNFSSYLNSAWWRGKRERFNLIQLNSFISTQPMILFPSVPIVFFQSVPNKLIYFKYDRKFALFFFLIIFHHIWTLFDEGEREIEKLLLQFGWVIKKVHKFQIFTCCPLNYLKKWNQLCCY